MYFYAKCNFKLKVTREVGGGRHASLMLHSTDWNWVNNNYCVRKSLGRSRRLPFTMVKSESTETLCGPILYIKRQILTDVSLFTQKHWLDNVCARFPTVYTLYFRQFMFFYYCFSKEKMFVIFSKHERLQPRYEMMTRNALYAITCTSHNRVYFIWDTTFHRCKQINVTNSVISTQCSQLTNSFANIYWILYSSQGLP